MERCKSRDESIHRQVATPISNSEQLLGNLNELNIETVTQFNFEAWIRTRRNNFTASPLHFIHYNIYFTHVTTQIRHKVTISTPFSIHIAHFTHNYDSKLQFRHSLRQNMTQNYTFLHTFYNICTQYNTNTTQFTHIYTQILHRDTHLHTRDTLLRLRDTQIQHKDTRINQRDTILRFRDTILHCRDTQFLHRDTQIRQRDTK